MLKLAVIIIFIFDFTQFMIKNPQKPKRILSKGLLFGNKKTLTFRTFSEMSRFYVNFTHSEGVTA